MERTRGRAGWALSHLLTLTDQSVDVLESGDPDRMLADFGAMLHEGWETKKRLSSVSGPEIDALYARLVRPARWAASCAAPAAAGSC